MTETKSSTHGDAPLVSVILATYNEKDSIADTVRSVLEHVRPPVEVIVVDDNSPDGTAGVVESLGDARVGVVSRKRGRGLASAVALGIVKSKGDVVCWIDADMNAECRYLPAMIEGTRENDLVIASRFVDGGGDQRHPVRVYASHLINGFANLVLGYGIKDYDSCVCAVRRPVFDEVMPIPYGFGDFFIEFAYDCRRRGFKVVEIPYVLGARGDGESKSFPSLGGFLWLGFKYCVRIVATRLRPD